MAVTQALVRPSARPGAAPASASSDRRGRVTPSESGGRGCRCYLTAGCIGPMEMTDIGPEMEQARRRSVEPVSMRPRRATIAHKAMAAKSVWRAASWDFRLPLHRLPIGRAVIGIGCRPYRIELARPSGRLSPGCRSFRSGPAAKHHNASAA